MNLCSVLGRNPGVAIVLLMSVTLANVACTKDEAASRAISTTPVPAVSRPEPAPVWHPTPHPSLAVPAYQPSFDQPATGNTRRSIPRAGLHSASSTVPDGMTPGQGHSKPGYTWPSSADSGKAREYSPWSGNDARPDMTASQSGGGKRRPWGNPDDAQQVPDYTSSRHVWRFSSDTQAKKNIQYGRQAGQPVHVPGGYPPAGGYMPAYVW